MPYSHAFWDDYSNFKGSLRDFRVWARAADSDSLTIGSCACHRAGACTCSPAAHTHKSVLRHTHTHTHTRHSCATHTRSMQGHGDMCRPGAGRAERRCGTHTGGETLRACRRSCSVPADGLGSRADGKYTILYVYTHTHTHTHIHTLRQAQLYLVPAPGTLPATTACRWGQRLKLRPRLISCGLKLRSGLIGSPNRDKLCSAARPLACRLRCSGQIRSHLTS